MAPRFERIAPYRFYAPRPYRPGFSLGFGIFFGRPFPYRYSYPVSPYGYSTVVPAVAYGGISFEMSPGDADLYVDGDYVGVVDEFDGRAEPLTLAAGRHRIELQAPGYAPMAFDVDVLPGQVIPFQGAMQPAY